MQAKIKVKDIEIKLIDKGNNQDYICLTDMTKGFEGGEILIDNWLRNKNTIEFLGVWERLYNPDFNPVEFDGIMQVVGLNRVRVSELPAGPLVLNYLHPDIGFKVVKSLRQVEKNYSVGVAAKSSAIV